MQIRRLAVGLAVGALAVAAYGCEGDDTEGGGGQTTATGTTTTGAGGNTSTGSGTSTGGGTSTGTNTGGGESCPDCTDPGFICCDGTCVNPNNDINNCGACGDPCTADHPFCDNGTCADPPDCTGAPCVDTNFCCGQHCCTVNQLCCVVPGPVETGPECFDPAVTNGTCPLGCTTCVCASPDTLIGTPAGDRPIALLDVGDLVYSVHQGQLQAVPILQVNRQAVHHHRVVQVELATGRVLEISGPHPTADGRAFDELRAGGRLDGATIAAVRAVPYGYAHTYDILPDSDTGTYVAAGVLIGSTLTPPMSTP